MNKRLMAIGVIILLIFITGIFSIVSVIESPDYLMNISGRENEIYIGGFFQLLMVLLYGGLIVCIVPLMEKRIAMYFVVSRGISMAFHLVGIILLMLFIPLSEAYLLDGSAQYEILGDMLRLGRDLINHIGVILPYLLGSILFYMALLRKGYIKKWLFYLGMIGVILASSASILILFNVMNLVSIAFALMSLPLALQEIVLAMILIVKGKQSAPS